MTSEPRGEPMTNAWNEICRLIDVRAVHRQGFVLADVRPIFILGQAQGELDELKRDPQDPVELADLLGVLFHYAIKQGWTMEQLERLMLDKFKKRFTEPRGPR